MASKNAHPIGVVLVDDHEVVRLGLKTALARSKAVQVIGEAGSIAEALPTIERERPEVVIMDVRLPDGNGVEACRIISQQFPASRVLFLTSYNNDEALVGAIDGGAAGYLLKDVTRDELIEAIKRIAAGQSVLDPSVTREVLNRLRGSEQKSASDVLSVLSAQEQKVLTHLADGKSNKEIATSLVLTEKTVRNYLYRIYRKIHVTRRTQAINLVLKNKLS